jgi:chromosome segregation ATPase
LKLTECLSDELNQLRGQYEQYREELEQAQFEQTKAVSQLRVLKQKYFAQKRAFLSLKHELVLEKQTCVGLQSKCEEYQNQVEQLVSVVALSENMRKKFLKELRELKQRTESDRNDKINSEATLRN